MAKAIAKPPRLSTSHPKFHDRKHAPELDILPMLLAAAGGSPGQIMGKNCTLPGFLLLASMAYGLASAHGEESNFEQNSDIRRIKMLQR